MECLGLLVVGLLISSSNRGLCALASLADEDGAPESSPGATTTSPSEVAALRAVPAAAWRSSVLISSDPCQAPWPGISCTNNATSAFQHVIGIHLEDEDAQVLSDLLSVAERFTHLTSLEFLRATSSSSSNITSSIPASLGESLRNLELLELSDNGAHLGGKIPLELGKLTSLKRLILKGNQLSGEVPDSLCMISSLELLDLARNQLEESILSCLGSLRNLAYLNLEDNRLRGSLPEQLTKLSSLETLRCGRNLLQGELPEDLGKMRSLQLLDFSFNLGITGAIPRTLGNLSELVELRLFAMGLNGSIPSEIGQLRNLKKLLLQSNFLTGSIPASISKLSSLELLQLQGNDLSGTLQGLGFSSMTSLQGMYLQANGFSGGFPLELTQIPSLAVVNIGFNQLEGQLPLELDKMINLEWLLLSNNRFSGPVPSSIASLTKLSLLDLSNNRFNGTVPSSVLAMAMVVETNLAFNSLNSSSSEGAAALLHEQQKLCIQKNPCRSTEEESSTSSLFAINAGGPPLNSTDHRDGEPMVQFQGDNVHNVSVGFFIAGSCSSSSSWAVSITGARDTARMISTNSSIQGDTTSSSSDEQQLYRTARVGGDSIAYYGRCMIPGRYVVQLHFVELEPSSVDSPGRRVFDVLVQEELVEERVDVFARAGGAFVKLILEFEAVVPADSSVLKVELRGMGSWNQSSREDVADYNGPIVSALRVFSNVTGGGAGATKSSGSSQLWPILGSSIGVLVVICTGLLVALACWLRRAEKRAWLRDEEDLIDHHHPSFNQHQQQPLAGLLSFEYPELAAATDKFSSENLIGQGAYGKVYKGILPDGRVVAIKQLLHRTPTCQRWFHHELQVISSVRHKNLVPLIGCCIDRGFPLLVCEYMPNGNLQNALFSKDSGIFLTWELRFRIAVDVARGLQYLHEDSSPAKIVHRDVKPGNILLDKNMNAHISDFGLAKLIEDREDSEVVVTSVMGTRGYLAPEYVLHGELSEKVDVYSYGIVLLELLSGRRGMQSSMNLSSPEPVSIDEWAWEALISNKVEELVDARLDNKFPTDELIKLVQVAMWCTHCLPNMRPSMGQVILMLIGRAGVPELPSERMTFDEFKDVATSSYEGSSTIWASMNGSSTMSDYKTANVVSLPDPKIHHDPSGSQHLKDSYYNGPAPSANSDASTGR